MPRWSILIFIRVQTAVQLTFESKRRFCWQGRHCWSGVLAGQSAGAANLATASGASCPAKTDCASYTLSVPAANPAVGTFSASGTQSPALPPAGAAAYAVDAIAYVQGGNTLDCMPSELQTSSNASNAPLTVSAGASVTAATLAFRLPVDRDAFRILRCRLHRYPPFKPRRVGTLFCVT